MVRAQFMKAYAKNVEADRERKLVERVRSIAADDAARLETMG